MNFQLTQAAIDALAINPGLRPSTFKLGSGTGYVPTLSDTNIHGSLVLAGNLSAEDVITANVIRYSVILGYDVGPFSFGEVGLFTSTGILFALGVADVVLDKFVLDSPEGANALRLDAYLSNVGTAYDMWLDVAETSNTFQMAVLNSVDQLPPGSGSVPAAYIIRGKNLADSFRAYIDGYGLWNFDEYVVGTMDGVVGSADLMSVTLPLSAYFGYTGISSDGDLLLEFITGTNFSSVRIVHTAIISGPNITLSYLTPLTVAPVPGDKFILFTRRSGAQYVLPIASTTAIGGVKIGSGIIVSGDGTLSVLPGGYVLPNASPTVLGGVKIGSGLAIDGSGVLSATGAVASVSGQTGAVVVQATDNNATTGVSLISDGGATTGDIKLKTIVAGANITVAPDANGNLQITGAAAAYTLPVATAEVLGGVKQGANVTIAGDGTISVADPYVLPIATATVLGGVKQGTNVTIAADGTISVPSPSVYTLPNATTTTLGGVIVGTGLGVTAGTISNSGVLSFNTRTGAVTLTAADITAAGGALLASPTFTGVPAAPTAAPGANTTQLATTAFVTAAITAATTGVSSFNTRTGAVTLTAADITGATGALLASPAFTGVPTAPTATAGTNTTQLATTAFVNASISTSGFAPIASPTFTGIPAAPTAAPGTTTTQLATTAFVQAAVAAATAGVSSFNTRTGAVTLQASDVTGVGGALLASPTFTGVPAAPTATAGTNTTQIATTAFVGAAINGLAPLASPTFTGTPSAPTAAPATNTTQIATTAFVTAAITAAGSGVTSFNTRTGAVTLTAADITSATGALLASPSFTGTPLAPTATAGTNTTQIATTAFVGAAITAGTAGLAPKASPTFTGVPLAPTAAPGTNTTQIATTAFVAAAVAAGSVTSFNTRTGAVTLTASDITAAGGALLVSPVFTNTVSIVNPTGSPSLIINDTSGTNQSNILFEQNGTTFWEIQRSVAQNFNIQRFVSGAFVDNPISISNATGVVTFTVPPVATTAAPGTNTTQLATTAFVTAAVAGATAGVSSFNTRTGAVTLQASDVTGVGGALLASPAFTGTPTAPTPAQFDNSTKIATTAFVERAQGNYQTRIGLNSSQVLTLTQLGSVIVWFGTAGTLTLPSAATVGLGNAFTFVNQASQALTVLCAGSDFIAVDGTAGANVTSIVIQPGGNLVLGGTATTQYDAVLGSALDQFNAPVLAGIQATGKVNGVNAPNLLLNGSGEFNNIGWGSSTFASTPGGFGEGTLFLNGAAIVSGTIIRDASNQIPVGAGVTLTISAQIATGGMTQGRAYVNVEAFNSSNASLGLFVGTAPLAFGSPLTYNAVASPTPAGTAYVIVYKTVDSNPLAAAFGVTFKRIKLELGNAASLYSQEASISWLQGSPAFAGIPTAPTATAGDSTTKLATTAFVAAAVTAGGGAPLNSPAFTGTPTAPTPAQFDNTTRLATTAFVRQSQGNFASFSGFTTSQVLTAAQAGFAIDFFGSAPSTFTLPAQAAVPAGSAFFFMNTGSAALTIAKAGTDTVLNGAPSMILNTGDTLYVVASNGPGQWVVMGGSASFQYLNNMVLGGRVLADAFSYTVVALSSAATQTLDLAAASEFTMTITGATTIAFTNTLAASTTQVVYLRLTNAGAFTIAWPSGTKFANGSAPAFTAAGVDLVGVKYDSTTATYMVFVIGLAIA